MPITALVLIPWAMITSLTQCLKLFPIMHNPPHPGLTIKEDILPALGLNSTEAANLMGVSPGEFIKVINGESPITPELALLLQRWLGAYRGGGTSIWLRQQERYNQWQSR